MELIIALLFLLFLVFCMLAAALYVAGFILEGIAFTKLAKKKPFNLLWMVWVPVLSDFAGKKIAMAKMCDADTIILFGKRGRAFVCENKLMPLWIYLVMFGATSIINLILGLLSLIPLISWITTPLLFFFIVWFLLVCISVEESYLYQILNTLRPNKVSNTWSAWWVTVSSAFTCGFVRGIYLLVLVNSATKNDKNAEDTSEEISDENNETTIEETAEENTKEVSEEVEIAEETSDETTDDIIEE